ncbi:MAG: uroporphyrinogen decarboxylase family protein [Candidatus Humimicrobiaceae bacterium]
MNKKERIEAAIRGKAVDRIPWTAYKSIPPWGEAEFDLRSEGLTWLYQHFPISTLTIPTVEVIDTATYTVKGKSGKNSILRKFVTPVGDISVRHEFFNNSIPGPGDLIQRFGAGIETESLSWVTEHPFKTEADYEILEYIYNNFEFHDNSEEFIFTEKIIGTEGFTFANMGKSPFQILLYELMGAENCYLEYYSNPKKFRKLYEVLYAKMKQKYELAADSAAPLCWSPENLTSVLTPPGFFKEFYMPFYNEMADILHKKGKLFAIHMDGKLDALKELIGQTKIDIIEAFTPLPMGDMSALDARKAWPEKIIWINFPGTLIATYSTERIKEYTINMLKSVAPGDKFLIGCTESFPVDKWGKAFKGIEQAIKESGIYPIKQ